MVERNGGGFSFSVEESSAWKNHKAEPPRPSNPHRTIIDSPTAPTPTHALRVLACGADQDRARALVPLLVATRFGGFPCVAHQKGAFPSLVGAVPDTQGVQNRVDRLLAVTGGPGEGPARLLDGGGWSTRSPTAGHPRSTTTARWKIINIDQTPDGSAPLVCSLRHIELTPDRGEDRFHVAQS